MSVRFHVCLNVPNDNEFIHYAKCLYCHHSKGQTEEKFHPKH